MMHNEYSFQRTALEFEGSYKRMYLKTDRGIITLLICKELLSNNIAVLCDWYPRFVHLPSS
jgi:hypothetical protein